MMIESVMATGMSERFKLGTGARRDSDWPITQRMGAKQSNTPRASKQKHKIKPNWMYIYCYFIHIENNN